MTFLIFVGAGWPGRAADCVTRIATSEDGLDGCYCESFAVSAVVEVDRRGVPILDGDASRPVTRGGVRKKVNTWFNLYSILTSGLVMLVLLLDRRQTASANCLKSSSWIPDVYVFAVLFLGLGSMWFHASLKAWGGWLDRLSMFVYASFLSFYTIVRIWNKEWIFWVGYPITVVVMSVLNIVWTWEYASLVLIITLVLAYLVFEVLASAKAGFLMGRPTTVILWCAAVLCIGLATLSWILSQTGEAWCPPESAFQPHGLLWHPLAGATAVLLYFYWRAEEELSGGQRPASRSFRANLFKSLVSLPDSTARTEML